ncbi:MAG: fumarate hydratase [Armatimonadota bacterium]|nr:fumarate hydratase [Armatimonadota bacterium]MDR7426576.1 fumarate hydratase [Armatimonadota bacterium]MDR7463675.1 fumarate hydratase [Armatimonadota bacterium]MDR7468596.1 fumarate hydratase [Armatimonadota bacterium]MDR7475994.1 fumarate hydratase [Armatimonadota bacterium]
MRVIPYADVVAAVRRLCLEAAIRLPADVWEALRAARQREQSPLGRRVLDEILENDELAAREAVPMCQDTGTAVVFAELGEDARVEGGLSQAIDEGVRQGYRDAYLRKSIVADPLRRRNTGDNTPAVVHVELVPGDRLRLTLLPKGGGAENMSRATMLAPAQGEAGVRAFVLQTVETAGPNACPPLIVGVGIGGTFDSVGLLAKRALLRPVGERHPDPYYAAMEEDLLEAINGLGLGPMGYGGTVTALDVHIEAAPCHIASLPVAVNLQCHAARVARTEV